MLYSQSVKNMVSGISQQTPTQRYPEQLEEQVNGLSTESNGLQKRPPTLFLRKLFEANSTTFRPMLHFIDRDVNEKYIVFFRNSYSDTDEDIKNRIMVYDFNGNQKKVTFEGNTPAYVKSSNTLNDIRVVTVADHTFIVNRKKTVKMSSELSPNRWDTQGALIHVIQGQYGRTYSISIDGEQVASHQTPDGSKSEHTSQIATNYIRDQLATQVKAKGYTVDVGESWLRINNKEGKTIKEVTTRDSFNNQAMRGFTSVAQRFNLLPSTAPDNYTLKIKTDPNGEEAGSYYVRYDATDKVWEECPRPNINISYDKTTMPVSLVRNADGSFTVRENDWTERKVGDDDSNPYPSFVDATINDVFFYRNRLGFLSGENIILSESSEYFNFWQTTASDILDIDPIDVTTTTSRINILNYAVPFAGELYCFSDKSQFVLRSDTVLSPRDCALVEVTSFQSSPDCRPVTAGIKLYFASKRSEYTSIYEYYSVQDTSDEKNATDISSHVPNYIPNGVNSIIAGNNENILLISSDEDLKKLYVYKYLFVQEQKVQSSWSEWNFDRRVLGAYFIGSELYLVFHNIRDVSLEKINFTLSSTKDYEDEPYRIYLDTKKRATQIQYNSTYDQTRIQCYAEYEIAYTEFSNMAVITDDGQYFDWNDNPPDTPKGWLYLSGDYRGKTLYLGIPYRFYIKFSSIYLQSQNRDGKPQAMIEGRLQLRYVFLNFADTGDFTAYVSDQKDNSKKAYTYNNTTHQLGTLSAQLNTVPSQTGVFKIPIQKLNTNCVLWITSATPFPLSFINWYFEGTWTQRNRKV